jgi:2-polyprenyl-6-methoxyphenol hydroxylase-like FAD-dependent oxidoreductase
VDDAKDPDDISTWTFNITRIWRGESPKIEGDAAVKIIKENTLPFCEPFKSAAEALSYGSSAFVRSLTYWRPVPWPNHGGRITLAGDSCHTMLPCESSFQPNTSPCFVVRTEYANFTVSRKVRGQGVNHAIDDAAKVVAALVEVSKGNQELKPAMDAYGAEVVERCAQAVDTAINEGKMVQDMDKLRNMVVAIKGVDK